MTLRPGYRAAGEVGWMNAGSAPAGVLFSPVIRGRFGAMTVAVVVEAPRAVSSDASPTRPEWGRHAALDAGGWTQVTRPLTNPVRFSLTARRVDSRADAWNPGADPAGAG